MRALRCYAFGVAGDYEAICVDLDIAVQGSSFQEVYETLNAAVASYVQDAQKEDEATARKLLSRRAPWHVRTGYGLQFIAGLLARRVLNGRSEASFDLACPA